MKFSIKRERNDGADDGETSQTYFPGYSFDSTDFDVKPKSTKKRRKTDHGARHVDVSDDEGSCEKAMELLKDIAEKDLPTRKKRRIKARPKQQYEDIINGLRSRVITSGFAEDELQLIWKVVSRSTRISCGHLRSMILLMIPITPVKEKFIRTILNWLKIAQGKGAKPTVISAVYQLLEMYAENLLLDDDVSSKKTILTLVLSSKTHNMVIPWKMRLFRKIVTPELLDLVHVEELAKLRRTPGLKKTQQDDIVAGFGYTKFMRPDLFYNDDTFRWKFRKLKIPETVTEVFQQHKIRVQAQAKELHPKINQIFPEFLPGVFMKTNIAKYNLLGTMIDSLQTDRGIARMILSSDLMKVFTEWLELMLNHRLDAFSGFNKVGDLERYKFIFEVCEKVAARSKFGIPALQTWLSNLIQNWDAWCFRNFLDNLIPLLHSSTLLPQKERLQEQLVNQFTNCHKQRSRLWTMIERLFNNWWNSLQKIGASNSEIEEDSTIEGLKWLFLVMEECLVSITLANSVTTDGMQFVTSPFFVHRICGFYLRVQRKLASNELKMDDDLRQTLMQLPTSLPYLVKSYGNDNCVNSLVKIALIRTSETKNDAELSKDVAAIILEFKKTALLGKAFEVAGPDLVSQKRFFMDLVIQWYNQCTQQATETSTESKEDIKFDFKIHRFLSEFGKSK